MKLQEELEDLDEKEEHMQLDDELELVELDLKDDEHSDEEQQEDDELELLLDKLEKEECLKISDEDDEEQDRFAPATMPVTAVKNLSNVSKNPGF